MKAKKELENYGIKISQSKNDDRSPIDFALQDKDTDKEYATVWGASPNDVEYECNHPEVEYDDDETVGECVICGSTCDWHYEASADDGYTIQERVPHEWYPCQNPGGLIGEYLKELQGKNA